MDIWKEREKNLIFFFLLNNLKEKKKKGKKKTEEENGYFLGLAVLARQSNWAAWWL